ncbi:MAG TPA: tRNA pseudouridine(38-40) synthase TruA [Streptosporangiaceae bacterium]|nr:tRNA pseudouridine(38-40) synthase TruA [Streptosporangiaceae bacterium]
MIHPPARLAPCEGADVSPAGSQARLAGGNDDQVRLRLDLGYDGTDFHGWAAQRAQPGTRTVQSVVEQCLFLVLRTPQPPVLTVAGRTDAGVHARGQVAHLDVGRAEWAAGAPNAHHRLNRLLPSDIRLHAIGLAAAGFDARFSALWRRYSYRVCDSQAQADPLRRQDTLWHPRALDVDQMNAAAASCLGEHDFAAFCRRREGATTIRQLIRFDWERAEPGVAVATVIADAFCHNMVRALTGAFLSIGEGRRPVEWIAEVLAAGVRDPAVRVAPPHGLCLEEVAYPPESELAARAAATRRVRVTTAHASGCSASGDSDLAGLACLRPCGS